jgi:hypothetical protein
MSEVVKKFKVVIPAQLSKGADGEWIIQGLASSPSKDQQGEILLPEGIDATPIDQGRGIINWDHQKGPENTLGLLDSYTKTKEGFFVKGRLFKNHKKAQSVYEIMSSLGKSDHGRMGLSVEGKILERGGKDGKIIKKCQINAVALTMNPVNQDSYVDLVKSLTADEAEVDFQATEENTAAASKDAMPVFTAEQVAAIVKSLCLTEAQATAKPSERSGGDALAREELDKKPKSIAEDSDKPSKKLKKLSKDMYKSSMLEILDKIHGLYPNNSKAEIWMAIKDRLNKRFPYLQRNDD